MVARRTRTVEACAPGGGGRPDEVESGYNRIRGGAAVPGCGVEEPICCSGSGCGRASAHARVDGGPTQAW